MSGDGILGRLIIGFTTLDSYHKTQNDADKKSYSLFVESSFTNF